MKNFLGALVALASLLLAAFGLGRRSASATAKQQRTAAAEKRIGAMKNANDAQQNIGRLSDDDVDQRLRRRWTRRE